MLRRSFIVVCLEFFGAVVALIPKRKSKKFVQAKKGASVATFGLAQPLHPAAQVTLRFPMPDRLPSPYGGEGWFLMGRPGGVWMIRFGFKGDDPDGPKRFFITEWECRDIGPGSLGGRLYGPLREQSIPLQGNEDIAAAISELCRLRHRVQSSVEEGKLKTGALASISMFHDNLCGLLPYEQNKPRWTVSKTQRSHVQ